MKVGQRGQVTIPKNILVRFGLAPETEVEFQILKDAVVLKKKPSALKLDKWKGRRRESFARFGCASVDEFIEDVRGR